MRGSSPDGSKEDADTSSLAASTNDSYMGKRADEEQMREGIAA